MDHGRIEKIKAFFFHFDPSNIHHQNAIVRALQFMWQRQTSVEQSGAYTHESNGIGFNKYDAQFAASLMDNLSRYNGLTQKQTAAAAKMLKKYSRQLAEMPAAS